MKLDAACRILTVLVILTASSGVVTLLDRETPAVIAAGAEDTWLREMDDLCSQTNQAMAFSVEQLRSLVERCDQLKPRIEALDESARKVYGKRLKMCRDFYAFMLESRMGNPQK